MNEERISESAHGHVIRTLAYGTLWRLLRYPFVILSAVLVPRLMEPGPYGRFAYFVSAYVMLDMLSDVGITQVLGRFVPELQTRGREELVRFLRSMLIWGMSVTGLVLAVAVLPAYLSGRVDFGPSWWGALILLLLLTKLEGTLFAFLYGHNEIGRYSFKELLRSAATFGFVLAGFAAWGLDGAVWALLGAEIAQLLVGLWWTRPFLSGASGAVSWPDFRPYAVFGLKFFVPLLILGLLQRSGNFFVRHLAGDYDQVAFYDVANQFMLLTATFLGLLIATLLPTLTAFHLRGDQKSIQTWNRNVMTYCTAAVFLVVNALVTLGRPVLTACLGGGYGAVYVNAVVLSLAILPALVIAVGANLTVLDGKWGVYVAAVAVGLAVMAAGCWVLAPGGKAVGGSWATVLGYFCAAVTFCLAYRRDMGPVLQGVLRALLPSLPAYPLWYYLWWRGHLYQDGGILVCVGVFLVSTVAYLAIVFGARIIRIAEIRLLFRVVRE